MVGLTDFLHPSPAPHLDICNILLPTNCTSIGYYYFSDMFRLIVIIIIINILNGLFAKCISLCYTGLVIPLGSKRTFCFRCVDAKNCRDSCRIFYGLNLIFLISNINVDVF